MTHYHFTYNTHARTLAIIHQSPQTKHTLGYSLSTVLHGEESNLKMRLLPIWFKLKSIIPLAPVFVRSDNNWPWPRVKLFIHKKFFFANLQRTKHFSGVNIFGGQNFFLEQRVLVNKICFVKIFCVFFIF